MILMALGGDAHPAFVNRGRQKQQLKKKKKAALNSKDYCNYLLIPFDL